MKYTFILLAGIMVFASCWIAAHFNAPAVPFKAAMSSPEQRAQWEHFITQDPATGEVPVTRSAELAFASHLPQVSIQGSRSGDYEWTARGPFNYGGRTRGAAFDVRDESIMIAGSVSGGIYRSENGGADWTRTSDAESQWGISCLTQDTRTGKEDTWYAGSGESFNSASQTTAARYVGNGILKSTDNGETWFALESTQTASPETQQDWDLIWRVVVDPTASEDVVLAAIRGGIMRSEDGGETWQEVLTTSGINEIYSDLAVTSTGVFYASIGGFSGTGAVFRSTDGINWANISSGNLTSNLERTVFGINPSNENEVYFMASTPGVGKLTFNFLGSPEWTSFWKYTYLSGDGSGGGGSWEDRSINLPKGPFPFDDINLQGGYNMLVTVSPDDPNMVIIGGTNLYRSTSAFADSTSTTFIGGYGEETFLPDFQIYDTHHPDQHLVFFSQSEPDVMISCNDGGVFRTDDITATPVVWESLNNAYNTTQFYSVAIDHGTPNSPEVMGGLQDNGTFYNNSDDPFDWKFPWSYDGAYTAIADGGNMHLTSIQRGRMFKIELDANGNRTGWKRFDPIGPSEYFFIHPWSMDPNDNGIVYLPVGNRVWRNDIVDELPIDNGADSISDGWTQFPFALSGSGSCAGVSTNNPPHRVYVGTSTGRAYRIDDANGSSETFTDVSNFQSGQGYVNCIAVDPEDGDHAMAIFSNYNVHSIYFTEDAGETWYRGGGNLEAEAGPDGAPADLYNISTAPSIRWAKIMNVDGEKLYVLGTSVGLFATNALAKGVDRTSDSTVWYQLAKEQIGNTVVFMIDGRESDGYMAVATHGAGIFSAVANNNWVFTGAEEVESRATISFYPNPATDHINIRWDANQEEYHSLTILDAMGRAVPIQLPLSTMNGALSADISALSPGVYYAQLQGEKTEVIKFLVH